MPTACREQRQYFDYIRGDYIRIVRQLAESWAQVDLHNRMESVGCNRMAGCIRVLG